jgi:hypothetical protein
MWNPRPVPKGDLPIVSVARRVSKTEMTDSLLHKNISYFVCHYSTMHNKKGQALGTELAKGGSGSIQIVLPSFISEV